MRIGDFWVRYRRVREKIANSKLSTLSPIGDLTCPIGDLIPNWVFSSVCPLLTILYRLLIIDYLDLKHFLSLKKLDELITNPFWLGIGRQNSFPVYLIKVLEKVGQSISGNWSLSSGWCFSSKLFHLFLPFVLLMQ